MASQVFAIRRQTLSFDVVLLILRVLMGYAFIRHGTFKIENPLHWMGPQSQIPSILQALAAVSEFGGGIALILGLVTRLGAFGIFCTMIVASSMQRFAWGQPFISSTGGASYELALVFLGLAMLFAVNGPGRFSLDRILFGKY